MKLLNRKKISEGASFADIDPPLGMKFAFNICMGILFILASFIFALLMKTASIFFLLSISALVYIGIYIYRIMLCLEDKVYKITGECIGCSEPNTRRTIFGKTKERQSLKRNFIVIAVDDETIVKIYTPHSYPAWLGCEVTVYAPKNAAMCTSEGEVIINSIYHMYISNYQKKI